MEHYGLPRFSTFSRLLPFKTVPSFALLAGIYFRDLNARSNSGSLHTELA